VNPKRLIQIGFLIWAVAWFLPVHESGSALPDTLPGWEAVRLALSPIWPVEGIETGSWVNALLSVLSAFTNLVVLVAMLRPSQSGARRARRMAVALTGAVLINAHWFLLSGERFDLRVGYYLWWLSFVLLALGFRRLARGALTPVAPALAS